MVFNGVLIKVALLFVVCTACIMWDGKSSLADYLVVDTPGYKYVNSVSEPGSTQRIHLRPCASMQQQGRAPGSPFVRFLESQLRLLFWEPA